MKSRISRCHNPALIAQLDSMIFPKDDPVEFKGSEWWITSVEGVAVAFAGIKLRGEAAFLTRAGVLKEYRGHGLQSKLIAARVKYALAMGIGVVATYTLVCNPASSNNLIAQGFKAYAPAYAWVGRDVIYWQRGME